MIMLCRQGSSNLVIDSMENALLQTFLGDNSGVGVELYHVCRGILSICFDNLRLWEVERGMG
jgi:predicted Rdx family selenoprotein